MASIKAVRQTEPDPKLGKVKPKSGVAFPYWDLDSVIEVAKTIHEKAGGLCDRAQLAMLLNYSGINNGSFLTRVSAAKMFGVIEDTDDKKLRVSLRGKAIIAPVSPADASRARVDAFLSVDLFKRVYDQFHGSTLPEQVGLRNLIENEYQVTKERVVPTVRIMLDSAEQAGLFSVAGARTRMVMPLGLPASASIAAPAPASPSTDSPPPSRYGNGGGGGGGGDDFSGIDPAIVGLLRKFPPSGEALSAKRRKVLIEAFTNMIAVIYPEPDSEQV